MLPYSCVCVLTPGLPDASRQAVGPDTQASAAEGSFCTAKQTRAKTAGVAETRRARETGKPGPTVQPRGKAAWPHARRTAGPFSPVTREAEQGRPLGLGFCGQDQTAIRLANARPMWVIIVNDNGVGVGATIPHMGMIRRQVVVGMFKSCIVSARPKKHAASQSDNGQ